jgi:hypothetical protein
MYINIEHLGNTLIATDLQITPYYELRSGAISMVVRLGALRSPLVKVDPARDLILGEEWPRSHLGYSNAY